VESDDRQEQREKGRQISRQSRERRDIALMKWHQRKGNGAGHRERDGGQWRNRRRGDDEPHYSKTDRPDPPPGIGSYSASIVKEDQVDDSKEEKKKDQRHRRLGSQDTHTQSNQKQRQQPGRRIAREDRLSQQRDERHDRKEREQE
jgi:hypothetical protein